MLRNKGFTLMELVAGMAIFLLLAAGLLPMCEDFFKIAETAKVNSACRLLATDIADVQSKTLYSNLNGPAYVIMLDQYGDGYVIVKNQAVWKNVKFSELGLSPVIATCANTNQISFTENGSPKRAVSVNVYCKESSVKRKLVEVQPVTGRIVIKDATA